MQLVQRSKLLSEERKERLLDAIPSLTNEQKAHLEHILISEGTMIQEDTATALRKAIAEDYSEALEQLGHLLHDAERTLRKEHENAERTQEGQDTQSFFSNAA